MNRRAHPGGYLVAAIALVCLALAGPPAWATPAQTRPGQMTVPTPTPKGQRTPTPTTETTATPSPVASPSATTAATATPIPPTAAPGWETPTPTQIPGPGLTPAPSQTVDPRPSPAATPQPTAGSNARLTLTKQAQREQVWPGVTVRFTLNLTNAGESSLREVSLVDALPEGLDPGAVLAGDGMVWDGRTLRGQAAILPPEAQMIVVFTAVVRQDLSPGGTLTNRATASAAGGLQAAAEVTLVLPPAELPPTGGFAFRRWSCE